MLWQHARGGDAPEHRVDDVLRPRVRQHCAVQVSGEVLALQRRCRVGLADLESVLARIDGGGADPATEGLERRIQETEREMQNLLEQLEDAQAALQKREVSAFAHCSRSRSEIAPQHKSIGLVGLGASSLLRRVSFAIKPTTFLKEV